MIDEKDIDTIYKVILKFIPEVSPDPDEIEAIAERQKQTGVLQFCMKTFIGISHVKRLQMYGPSFYMRKW